MAARLLRLSIDGSRTSGQGTARSTSEGERLTLDARGRSSGGRRRREVEPYRPEDSQRWLVSAWGEHRRWEPNQRARDCPLHLGRASALISFMSICIRVGRTSDGRRRREVEPYRPEGSQRWDE